MKILARIITFVKDFDTFVKNVAFYSKIILQKEKCCIFAAANRAVFYGAERSK